MDATNPSDDVSISPDEIEGVPVDSVCEKCGVGWMIRSNQSSSQKRLGEFTWYFQATCDNCGFSRRDHRRYKGRLKSSKKQNNPQPDLF